ncbi:stage 0 sporulation protein [Candidatus Aerophobetes bacterium]|nr:stage 0 sporulation protein [Candidatus Aerophobetes bacterium]
MFAKNTFLKEKNLTPEVKEIEEKAYHIALKRISFYKLPMKLVATSYSSENKKLTFYYTAKKRIDFRILVKNLAELLKLRIQMRQIGARDEPQILGGCGICGREVCCALFLKKKGRLNPVSLETARIQGLSLVSSKISGICGKLRCCLNFEYPTYLELRKNFPKLGKRIEYKGKKLKVIEQNLLKGTIVVKDKEGVKKVIKVESIENI